ncbi:magnesium transporter [Xanthovirga aplysinae]|uniref:magnesium transporter n=1 Tax=Xanthovirga aplysinae TaxID=2529853 RepID=UPI0012BC6546|nr:magnesium transporter [Xanthovirga aplysinae]MTI32803.1 magnesium transporter [Xanthovirga aplysinae]
MTVREKQLLIDELLEENNLIELVPVLQELPVVEVGEILGQLENEHLLQILPKFTVQQQGLILSEFDFSRQIELFHLLDRMTFAEAFENMYSESRADLFQQMTVEEQTMLLPYLSKLVRENVIKLSAYPPETAGGIMSTDFATVLLDMSCEQAIAKIRADAPSKRMIYYVYVVDKDMRMQGFITLKDLMLNQPETLVRDALHREYVFARVDDDREAVASQIARYDLVAIPILNAEGQLVGIVTHDEAIEIIRAEDTEDLEKIMGIVPAKEELDYLDTSSWQHFKKRVVWIVSLAAVGIVSGMVIHHFEGVLDKLLILALYMPMVADTGGNTGSQAATVVIRAMSLGQISVANWFKVIWKETRIALFLSVCLGTLAFAKVVFLSWETEIPAALSLGQVAFAISLALSLQVITATIIGAALPLLVKRFGGDPAVAASPAITTVVDVTGLLIYFGVAVAFFSL